MNDNEDDDIRGLLQAVTWPEPSSGLRARILLAAQAQSFPAFLAAGLRSPLVPHALALVAFLAFLAGGFAGLMMPDQPAAAAQSFYPGTGLSMITHLFH